MDNDCISILVGGCEQSINVWYIRYLASDGKNLTITTVKNTVIYAQDNERGKCFENYQKRKYSSLVGTTNWNIS